MAAYRLPFVNVSPLHLQPDHCIAIGVKVKNRSVISIPGGNGYMQIFPSSYSSRPWLFPGKNFYSAPLPFWFIIIGAHISTPFSSFPHRCELPSPRPWIKELLCSPKGRACPSPAGTKNHLSQRPTENHRSQMRHTSYPPTQAHHIGCQWGWIGPSAGMLYSFPMGEMICQILKQMCRSWLWVSCNVALLY